LRSLDASLSVFAGCHAVWTARGERRMVLAKLAGAVADNHVFVNEAERTNLAVVANDGFGVDVCQWAYVCHNSVWGRCKGAAFPERRGRARLPVISCSW